MTTRPIHTRAAITATAAAALLASTIAPAAATPGNGVHAIELNHSVADGRDFVLRDITIDPGGTTGWHWHAGTVVGVVKQGTLTHYAADCAVDGVYAAGDSISEPSGADHVHVGRNLGPEPVVLEVLYATPVGEPLSGDAAAPPCGLP